MKVAFLFLLLLGQQAFAQVNLNLGLKAYYPFSGNANDVSGNNNNPIFNNATLAADRFGNANSAYQFNGIDNYMQIPNSPTINFPTAMSIAVWVKVNGFYNGTCHGNNILQKGDSDPTPGMYHLRFDDACYWSGDACGNPPMYANMTFHGLNAGANVGGCPPYITTGQWYAVVITYNGSNTNLYVNCQLRASGTGSPSFSNSSDLFLGKLNHILYPYWFNGVMDEVRLYDRALNMAEVEAYSNCGPPDLTSSQFFTSTQLAPGTGVDEVIALRNVGIGPTTGPINFTITNYSALTGLTGTPIFPGTIIPIGPDNYTISSGWAFNSGTGTFSSNNVIPPGGISYIGLRITRGSPPSQGANGIVTQTTTIAAGAGGELSPSTNNSISNILLKNGP